MGSKKRVLIVIDWFVPAYKAGGQIMSCYNLILLLKDIYEFDVYTSDRDLGDTTSFSGIPLNQWVSHPDGFRIWYAGSSEVRNGYQKVLSAYSYHAIYFNSFFSLNFTIVPLLLLKKYTHQGKLILAPRGMLGKGALALKRTKKKIFILLAKVIKLYDRVLWHATSNLEQEEIWHTMGGDSKIIVAHDTGSLNAPVSTSLNKVKNTLSLVFISRITEKKNLKFALDILRQLPQNLTITFDVYGPVEDKVYWETCTEQIHKMPPHILVKYCGEVKHEQVSQLFRSYHFFFFPTMHENYGHVIHEALSVSCPVLLSDQTPWDNLEQSHAGVSIPLSDKNSFISWLIKMAEMNQEEYELWRRGAFTYCERYQKSRNMLEQYNYLFQ